MATGSLGTSAAKLTCGKIPSLSYTHNNLSLANSVRHNHMNYFYGLIVFYSSSLLNYPLSQTIQCRQALSQIPAVFWLVVLEWSNKKIRHS